MRNISIIHLKDITQIHIVLILTYFDTHSKLYMITHILETTKRLSIIISLLNNYEIVLFVLKISIWLEYIYNSWVHLMYIKHLRVK